jgi:hypothetical protein
VILQGRCVNNRRSNTRSGHVGDALGATSQRPVLPAFVSADYPARDAPIVAGDHLAGFSISMCKHLRKRVILGDLKLNFPIHHDNPFKRKAVNEFDTAG